MTNLLLLVLICICVRYGYVHIHKKQLAHNEDNTREKELEQKLVKYVDDQIARTSRHSCKCSEVVIVQQYQLNTMRSPRLTKSRIVDIRV